MYEKTNEHNADQPQRKHARSILRQYYELRERRFTGDFGACDVLIDFESAVRKAKLTKRQQTALTLVYGECLTQTEAAQRIGVRQHTVASVVANGERRIDDVYAKWERLETVT